MTLDSTTLTRLYIAMREHQEIEISMGDVTIRTGKAPPVWRQPMIVRVEFRKKGSFCGQWLRSIEEVIEKLEGVSL